VSQTFLPYGRQEISDADVAAVSRALHDSLITQGPTVEAFEEAIAGYLGARHAVAFSSGTAALHGASFAAGLGPGDEAIVPPLTFVASANCALYQGARPRFVDVEPSTWNLDVEAAVAAASERTRAVVPVSFAGLPVDLRGLDSIRPSTLVIEDACHALGGRRAGAPVGSPGGADITCFSLHPVKAMTTGEGGVAVTEDDQLARRLRLFRTHGIAKEGLDPGPTDGGWYMEMQELGFNYRITDFQCALGLSQLERLDGWVERRNEVAVRYRELLADEERVDLPPAAGDGDLHGYHLFVIRVREGPEKRLKVFSGLRDAGIGVQVHYIPVYRMPYYRDKLGYPQDEWPATEEYYGGAISLPIFPAMTDTDVERVVSELRGLL
jgi:perosamine synthetase